MPSIKLKIRSSNTNNKNNENVSYLNSVEDGWLENVHPSVDFVRDEFLGLFNETFNFAIGGLVNDDTVLRGLVNFCDHNCTLKLNEAQNMKNNTVYIGFCDYGFSGPFLGILTATPLTDLRHYIIAKLVIVTLIFGPFVVK